ncbi:endonuclease/exonuclease/phosphatase family protein [Nocardioides sp. GXQ0305]|uniref:endonuclease/exonuclease/phosphatase family protein n=1 Tax=Nocardioides sp. GXQ0305 TaxID=3423912 RepID=UPI003D7CED30
MGRGVAAVVALVVGLALAAPPASAAPGKGAPPRALTVATYNVYLGADLTPLFTAQDQQQFVAAAGAVYAQMEHTDFPRRAEAIADQLAARGPDIVGLQEVAVWSKGPLGGPLETTYDFLPILLDALAARGLHYEAVATNANFGTTQPVPISQTEQASFLDRDVILARSDVVPRVKVSHATSALFQATLTLPSAIGPIAVPRGWSSVDVKVRGTRVRLANTHLEAFGGRVVRELQGRELIAALADSPYPVVVLGDLNTCPQDTDPCTLDSTYEDFRDAGYVDAWAERHDITGGWTSGQSASLDDPDEITHRIDYVLHRGAGVRASEVEVIGEEEDDRTGGTPDLWPSDHAGVVAELRLPRPARGPRG